MGKPYRGLVPMKSKDKGYLFEVFLPKINYARNIKK